jgi:sensor histidine kinase YesM
MSVTIPFRSIATLDVALGTGFALALNAVLFGDGYFSNIWIFLAATLCTTTIGIILSHIHHLLALKLQKRLSGKYETGGQLFLHILFFPLTALVISAIFFGYHGLHFPGYTLHMQNYKWALLIGFVADLLGIGFGMAIHSQAALKQTEVEKERLQKLQLQNELEILKNQVNPHFLFNSLNILSSLIGDDPQKAERFVDQLSKVYRYLLQTNQKAWTSVEAELNFIRSYAALLTTRYGDGVQVHINVEEECQDLLLPPLTLQLLVENAVKHNVVHKQRPLLIEITASCTTLYVRNNLQKKARQQVVSHGIGLKNILEKYRMLQGKTVIINEDADCFSVTLPLLSPSMTTA